ncbi:hypothetical protein LTR97_012292 [Elasticomyces elasticus]|uniref:Carboxylic ester hydrolase n=1 Tax=Elasticomyces elasticus TaxID=574655 RepID=A0AAN7ZZ88_9PEZI|nr:hypothetical protein LTR97_012292 [Elasticomyces elasticus]
MLLKHFHLALAALSCLPSALGRLQTCKARDLPAIEVFGLEIIDITAKEHHDYEDWTPFPLFPGPKKAIDFCNFTITYTHPGQNDHINVYIWLPMNDTWDGRFVAQGGGGWAAGFDMALAPSVARGYAVAITDAGHTFYSDPARQPHADWLLASPGNLDWALLQDFAGRALDDLPKIAKQVIKGFYGEPPKYSYWHGCSTGGRQGLMSAQRYPENYQGIVAAAPAINWAEMAVAGLWPHIVMRRLGYYPPSCELEAILAADVEACDELDGVKDGIIAAPGLCAFDATTVVGRPFDCEGDSRKISAEAAEIANEAWKGPFKGDRRLWFGMPHGTPFSVAGPWGPPSGLASTECDENNQNCKSRFFAVSTSWIGNVVRRVKSVDLSGMDEEEFYRTLRLSVNEFASVMSTNDPDLSDFGAAGGKMITWHGLADQLIPVNGTSSYYEKVLALDAEARSYYRYFEAPGVQHCFGGIGAAPTAALDQIIKWVEQGIAPETLTAATMPVPGPPDAAPVVKHRPLCPYPLVSAYVGGDLSESSSFECAESFDVMKRHTEL